MSFLRELRATARQVFVFVPVFLAFWVVFDIIEGVSVDWIGHFGKTAIAAGIYWIVMATFEWLRSGKTSRQ